MQDGDSGEIPLLASELSDRLSIPVRRRGSDETAVALVHLFQFGTITLRLRGGGREVTMDLPVGDNTQVARFVSEWLPNDFPDGFDGRLTIESGFPVSAVALQTRGGKAIAAVPALIPRSEEKAP